MAKSSPSLTVLLAAALVLAPAAFAARKKPPVTKVEPADENGPPPTPTTAKPGATPRPRMEDLDKILALSETDGLPLAAKGAIVIDAQTGAPLYEKNADEPQFPASTTKIMTALLVIEAGNLDQEVECTLEDSKVG